MNCLGRKRIKRHKLWIHCKKGNAIKGKDLNYEELFAKNNDVIGM